MLGTEDAPLGLVDLDHQLEGLVLPAELPPLVRQVVEDEERRGVVPTADS